MTVPFVEFVRSEEDGSRPPCPTWRRSRMSNGVFCRAPDQVLARVVERGSGMRPISVGPLRRVTPGVTRARRNGLA